ncbi:cytochrome P450 [Gonapodya prolifera JEL478]|uniref:Cytochrome P450 n=1 Tax=Gonapodya prolifera (strain JEL478) TaxID=1344416 RepID=A0A139AFL2_GONPJ|nr:cytochrome P450 [Gonapodya prolifera JEL478]|eukprot:KXS15601.1 cytochrome P450 [Gonapodya prolifera JEL478]
MLSLDIALVPTLGLLIAIFFLARLKWPDMVVFSKKRDDIPIAPGGEPLIGHTRYILRNGPRRLEALYETFLKAGEVSRRTVFSYNQGPQDLILSFNVQDVEQIMRDPYTWVKGTTANAATRQFFGDGIFVSDGDEWKVARKTASNIFNVKNFRDHFADDFITECDKLSAHLRTASRKGLVVDLQDLFLRCTLDSFARLAMGKDCGAIDQKFYTEGGRYKLPTVAFMNAFDNAGSHTVKRGINPFWEWTELFNGQKKIMDGYIKTMDDFAADVVREKRAKMAEASKAGRSVGELEVDLLDYFMKNKNEDGSELSTKQLRDIVMNFIIAGRDTTAQTLSWCFWRLAQHPEVYAKLREEAFRVLGRDGTSTYSDFKNLKYTNAVFNEVLRLHPNVPSSSKLATRDEILPGTKTRVAKGQRVFWSSYVMGRSTKIWGPDALEFRPERWLDKDGNLLRENQYKWPVFNAGPRICLGMNMATQEGVVFLSTLIRQFDFELVNEDDPAKWGVWHPDPEKREGRYQLAITLGMRGGLDFKVTELKL